MLARLLTFTVLSAAIVLAVSPPVVAQDDYPNKPITMVDTYAAGGSDDIIARLAAERLEKELGQPVNVVNVPGGAHIPGVMKVLDAPADGYTLLRWNTPSAVLVPLLRRVPYDPLKDIVPIFADATTSNVLYVGADSPIKTFRDFVDRAKEKRLIMGINHIGAPTHLSAIQLSKQFGLEFKYLILKTVPHTIAGLMGGLVDVAIGQLPQQRIFGNQIRAIAVLDARYPYTGRSVPGTPTVSEVFPDKSARTWIHGGVAVKAGTPQPIIDRLADASNKVLNTPEYERALSEWTTYDYVGGVDATRKLLIEGRDLYAPLIETLGMTK